MAIHRRHRQGFSPRKVSAKMPMRDIKVSLQSPRKTAVKALHQAGKGLLRKKIKRTRKKVKKKREKKASEARLDSS